MHTPTPPAASPDRSRIALGAYGERLACAHLIETGRTIVECNWRCALGEVDIVALENGPDGSTLVIVEVKTRSGHGYGHPAAAVNYRKMARLRRLAAQWLRDHPVAVDHVRLDVIAVTLPRSGRAHVQHFEGVFL